MRIGFLQTGHITGDVAERFGDYPDIYGRLLAKADQNLDFRAFPVVDGVFPDAPDACDGWLITGSRHGVYEDLPWIDPLKDFLRDIRSARVSLIGVCFGHQIMAEAFGGAAGKSDKGWGCGAHRYTFVDAPSWMTGAEGEYASHAMHQDQVSRIPADAALLATSPFCEFAALTYGDPEAPEAISVQSHPEFDADLERVLIELRAGAGVPQVLADTALASLGGPVNNDDFARWFVDYLKLAAARRQAA